MPGPRILLLDRSTPSSLSLTAALEGHGFRVAQTDEPARALESIRAGECDLILGEVQLAAAEVLAEVRRTGDAPPLIVFDDFGAGEGASAAAQGVFDTLARPVSDEEVLRAVGRALQSHALRLENTRLREELEERGNFGGLVSSDPRMRHIFETLESVADSRATLLICGESGTGKTQLAHAVHSHSSRRRAPFVEVNCAALPATLLESELFGHVRGAFTGAIRDRVGKFEQAGSGTIFLDEIGAATQELQLKLLRVLEEGRFERVGDARTRSVEARVIAATNVDLEEEIAAGRFRTDLYYRLNVIAIEVPPLRERVADVELLAARFRARFARLHGRAVEGFQPASLQRLCAHGWPGNVRELENTVERAVLVARGAEIEPDDLWPAPPGSGQRAAGTPPAFEGWEAGPPDALKAALEGPERWLILRALERHGGNRSGAARSLGVNRTTLFNKMRRYDLLSYPVRVPDGPRLDPRNPKAEGG